MLSLSTIYIDTSHLHKLISDFWCKTDASRRSKAHNFLNSLEAKGSVIFVSHHTLHELLALETEETVRDRLNFLEKLPVLASAVDPDNSGLLGHWMDVLILEIKYQLANPNAGYEDLCKSLQNSIVNYTNGTDLLASVRETYMGLRDYGKFKTQPTAIFESLLHSNDGNSIDDMKLTDLDKLEFKNEDDLLNSIPGYIHKTITDLEKHGDKKLENHESEGIKFAGKVLAGGKKLITANEKPSSKMYLELLGVRPDQVTPKSTFRDVSKINIFNKTIRQFIDDGKISNDDAQRINLHTLPSWTILHEIEKLMRAEPRASGSSVIDREHLVFTSYVDSLSCDKRVAHYLNISKNSHPIIKRAKNVCVAKSSYTDLIKAQE